MPKIQYVPKNFSPEVLAMIEHANEIIAQYGGDGYALTLRQLYYRFVSKNLFPNTIRSYKNLGNWVNDGRLAGLIDWSDIQDRTRGLEKNSHWLRPRDIMETVSEQFQVDMWARQKWRPEVWIEKDALVGVIERVCAELDIPYLSCRGYTSQSEMWVGAQRIQRWLNPLNHQIPLILHLGDHDPSGMDMSRDIMKRLKLFCGKKIELIRLALNMDQIEEFQPPPNPAKTTDSRSTAYIAEFGHDSWELDALEPGTMVALIRTAVDALRDKKIWKEDMSRLKAGRAILKKAADNWASIEGFLNKKGKH
jgi:hypothetical protein